jgi:hypothetical protein
MAVLSRPIVPASTRTPLLVLLATLLLLRSRLFSGPRELLSKLKAVTRGKRLTPEELAQVLEQVYVKQPDGSKLLLVPVKDSYVSEVRLFGSHSTFVWHFIPVCAPIHYVFLLWLYAFSFIPLLHWNGTPRTAGLMSCGLIPSTIS